ncbi:MAG TPA: magnesium/cobalt transporter CorA [Candidatus Nanoarchaeia archaeon]|nr:magnesium/cobalt transporter CorA [Candidatus Nanoarchaeia archaeon]
MIEVYEKRGDTVRTMTLDSFSLVNPSWIEARHPTPEELSRLSELTEIPSAVLQEYANDTERPHIVDDEKYSLIVLSGPASDNITKTAHTTPIFIFLYGMNSVLTLSAHELMPFKKIKENIARGKVSIMDNSGTIIRAILDETINDYFAELDETEDRIEELEETLLTKPDSSEARKIFALKKKLIYYHKALMANREVVTGIEKEYIKRIPKKEAARFRDSYNDFVQLIDIEETHRDILTGVLDAYLTSISNALNDVIKKLTVYASFVLVPTMISGIYGMNFRIMPEVQWKYGYIFSLMLMVVSVLVLYLFFKRKRWI